MIKIKINFEIFQKLKKYIKKYYILIILNILLATMSSLVSSAPIMLVQTRELREGMRRIFFMQPER